MHAAADTLARHDRILRTKAVFRAAAAAQVAVRARAGRVRAGRVDVQAQRVRGHRDRFDVQLRRIQIAHDLVPARDDDHLLRAEQHRGHAVSAAVDVEQLAALRDRVGARQERVGREGLPVDRLTFLVGLHRFAVEKVIPAAAHQSLDAGCVQCDAAAAGDRIPRAEQALHKAHRFLARLRKIGAHVVFFERCHRASDAQLHCLAPAGHVLFVHCFNSPKSENRPEKYQGRESRSPPVSLFLTCRQPPQTP